MKKITLALLPLLWSFASAVGQIELVDDLGRTVTLSSAAKRIISLAPSITETLFAIDAGDGVVGVTEYCDYPPEARSRQSIGGMIGPSVEMIVALNPDLIIVTPEGNAQESFRQIRAIGPPVFVTNPRSLDGIRKSILDLGTLAGRLSEARVLADKLREREDSLRATTTSGISVLFIISLQPLIVAGPGTFLAEMIQLAGGENIARGTGLSYPTFSREQVVVSNPAVIMMTTGLGGEKNMFSLFPEWKDVAAVASGRVYELEADLVSRPGPRAVSGSVRIRTLLLKQTPH